MMRKLFALSFALILAGVPMAQAEDLVFTLSNNTSVVLMELYVSPSDSDNWEEDVLGNDVVMPSESGDVIIADGLSTCMYDILGVFEDGDEVEDYEIDLCELGAYAFYE